MSWSRLHRLASPVSTVFLILPLLATGGCNSTDDVSSRMDDASRRRLAALPEQGMVLAACRFGAVPDSLPALAGGVRELGRAPRAVLLEIPRTELARLGELPGVSGVAVWGDGTAKAKLDPRLRLQVLQAWGDEDPAELAMIASFREADSTDLREHLEALGARVRTVAGPVVTLDADPETVFQLLALPDLVALRQPQTLNLLDGQ